MLLENMDYVVCPICNTRMKELTQHFLKVHNLTKEQLLEQFPNQTIVCSELSEQRKVGNSNAISKINDMHKNLKLDRIKEYHKNPKLCLGCNTIIPYDKRGSKYCNHSCAAKVYMQKRKLEGWELSKNAKSHISNKISQLNKEKAIKIKYCNCKTCNKPYTIRSGKCKKFCSNNCKNIYFVQLGNKLTEHNGNKNLWKYTTFKSRIYGKIHVDSSWEVKLLQSLEDNNINWVKPKHFKWIDINGQERKYFPDAYLPDYDIYLDPKNPYLLTKDQYKIDYVKNNYNIKLIVISDEKLLNWDYIKSFN